MPDIIFSEGSGVNNALYGKLAGAAAGRHHEAGRGVRAAEPLQEDLYAGAEHALRRELYRHDHMAGFKPGGENSEPPIDGFRQTYDKLLKERALAGQLRDLPRDDKRFADREHEIEAGGVRRGLLPHAGGVRRRDARDAHGRKLRRRQLGG